MTELYNMENEAIEEYLRGLSDKELGDLAGKATAALNTMKDLRPLYENLYAHEKNSKKTLVNLWRKINRKAREAAEENYNSLKSKISEILNRKEIYWLNKILDQEMDVILYKYPRLTKNHTIVQKSALSCAEIRTKSEIVPRILAEADNR